MTATLIFFMAMDFEGDIWGKGLGAEGPYPFPQTPIPNPLQGVGRGV